MRVMAVSGLHHSGKTTTVEHVVRELAGRGYSVGTVKSIHKEGFSIDTVGTNTHRHRMAGASIVTAVSDCETAVMMTRRANYEEIISWYDTDWVVLEGAKDAPYPRIVCARTVGDIEACSDEHTFLICGPVAEEVDTWGGIPVVDARSRAREVVDMAEKQIPHVASAGDRFETAVHIDGEQVALNPFTQDFVARTVLGMLSALKDSSAHGHEVKIEIRRF